MGFARWTTWANGQPISQAQIIYSSIEKKKKKHAYTHTHTNTHKALQGPFGWKMEKYEVQKYFSFSYLCFVGGGKLDG